MTKSITKVQYFRDDLRISTLGYWTVVILTGNPPEKKKYIRTDGSVGSKWIFTTKKEALAAEKLFHTRNEPEKSETSAKKGMNRFCEDCHNWATCTKKVIRMVSFCSHFVPKMEEKKGMREFESGATRNTVEGRLDYTKALSPIVLERYVQYLNAHRRQEDGSLRDFDNWKKGIPTDVWLAGLGRHFIAIWQIEQGFPAEDNKGPVTLEDSLCAMIFGASGWLHDIIKDKRSETTSESISAKDFAKELGFDLHKEKLVVCNRIGKHCAWNCIHREPHKRNAGCNVPCQFNEGVCD